MSRGPSSGRRGGPGWREGSELAGTEGVPPPAEVDSRLAQVFTLICFYTVIHSIRHHSLDAAQVAALFTTRFHASSSGSTSSALLSRAPPPHGMDPSTVATESAPAWADGSDSLFGVRAPGGVDGALEGDDALNDEYELKVVKRHDLMSRTRCEAFCVNMC